MAQGEAEAVLTGRGAAKWGKNKAGASGRSIPRTPLAKRSSGGGQAPPYCKRLEVFIGVPQRC